MKKILSLMVFAALALTLLACDEVQTVTVDRIVEVEVTRDVIVTVEVEKEVIVEVEKEVIVEVEKEVIVEVEKEVIVEVDKEIDLTPAPTVEGVVSDWIPGSLGANLTATLDILNGDLTSVMVVYNDEVLENYVDYEVVGDTLTIFGAYLVEKEVDLGDHTFKVVTNHGMSNLLVSVVETPVDTTIETTTELGVDMSRTVNYNLASPIVGAPDLLITELSTDMGKYEYIEVFNNTSEPYNLKGHRIVFANLTRQTLLASGIFEEPYGMAGGAFIYQEDYIVPALSSAVIWVVNAYPWNVESSSVDGVRHLYEADGAETSLFGDNPENLSIDKFRDIYGIDDSVLVFPVRPQYMLVNGTYSNSGDGLGAAIAKGSSSRWNGINSSIDNRGVQIQKFDTETEFSVDLLSGVMFGDVAMEVPAGATYFKYDVGVLNQEEDVYTDGVYDPSKMVPLGNPGLQREAINAFYARIFFYNDLDENLGSTIAKQSVDCYNADKVAYLLMVNTAVTPISTALVFPKLVTDSEGVVDGERWGAMHSMEYTIPLAGSTYMRFIPREEVNGYADFYAGDVEALKNLKLDALAIAVEEVLANVELIVPVDTNYDTSYLNNGYNSIGVSGWFNFLDTKPSE